jgi:hypothetical protein
MEKLIATVEKIAYQKADSDWYILKTSRGVAKGVIKFEVAINDQLELIGEWQLSQFSGANEFTFKAAQLYVPQDIRALLTYAITLTKGLGPATEQVIWDAFGEDWQQHDLGGIPGITANARAAWLETLERIKLQQEQAKAIAFLLGKGCTIGMASAAWGLWRETTISVTSKDCYSLTELPHYGFSYVDNDIRRAFGIGDADPRRIEAATLYVIGKLRGEVGTMIGRGAVIAELFKIVPEQLGVFDQAVQKLADADKLFVDGDSIAMAEDYENENKIWERFA